MHAGVLLLLVLAFFLWWGRWDLEVLSRQFEHHIE